ncbi:MAG TPA: FAD-binding oxidoreductase [Micromonosporaceae bacterium]|nr:FAD-binding oxidoreductase [Micromonosporaceae bacterium]
MTTIMGAGGPAVSSGAVAALAEGLQGQVILPGHDEYDRARRVWNGSIDRHPALVVRCAEVADVQAAVRFARERDLLIAVRGGGHNIAGSGTCHGGMVIDLSPMKGVRVDPATRMAWAQPGLLWRELDAQTQAYGLAVTGGIVSTTGVAGFTLGGGIGWLHRPYGLTVDNLVAADVVTAAGDLLRASEDSNPDVLWGLRGGGGNFGIVTTFEFRQHPVGPELMAGLVFYRAADLVPVVRGYREIMASAPDELTLFLVLRRAPAAPFLPPEVHGQPVVAVVGCYAGPLDDGARAMAPLGTLAPPIANVIQPRAYVQFQSMLDGSWTAGFGNYWKAEYLTGIPDAALDILAEHLHEITSALSDFKFAALGGAAGRVPPDATAFAHRTAPFILNINSRWALPGDPEPHVAWTRRLWEAMQPFSAGGVYVNFMGDEGSDRVRAAYGEPTYRRLVTLKNTYDPDNAFRLNQNIPPDPKPAG